MKSKDDVRQALLGILRDMDKECEFNIEQAFSIKIEDDTFEEQGLRQFDQLVDHLHAAQA